MKKCLLTTTLVAMFMIVAAFAWGQSIFYEEPFDSAQGWTLESNWSVSSGALTLGWSPSITNYDLSATSSDIIVPATAGDMVVSMYLNDFSTQGNPPETHEVIAVAGGVSNVLWSYASIGDWGVSGGQDLTLSLAPYAGQTIQLKFRSHGATTFNFNYWYIYDIKAYASLNNDLAATSITGSSTPSIGMGHPYAITVRNTGLTTLSDYTVKLMQTGNVELGSIAGTSIAPQGIIEYTIPWTPTLLGETQIWGKVVSAGDENPNNDETAPLIVSVMAAGLLVAEIGTDTTTNTDTGAPAPYGTWYKAFRQQFLYRADDLFAAGGIPGMITSLAFNVHDLSTCSAMNNFTIRLKHTNQAALSTTFETGEYTTVWQRASFLPNVAWNIHNFDEFFFWDGTSNLIVEIVTDMVTGSYTRNALVYYSSTSFASSLRYQSDSSNGSTGTSGSTTSTRSNIRFFMLPDGVGNVTGTVLGADGNPLAGVQVDMDIRLYSAVTDAQGEFTIHNAWPDDYAVTFSRHGYVTQTVNIVLEGGETEEINVTMNLMAQVDITGSILASDTEVGIAGAHISLAGYEDYSGSSTSNGSFTVPAVFANHSYDYTISAAGYTSTTGTIDVGMENYAMGIITLNEIAYAPNSVGAELNAAFNAVNLSWNAPNPNAVEITEGFEATTFPPADWSQIITNTGQANPLGVLPTWCSIGTIHITGSGNVTPTEGVRQAGLWWDYTHQDEWLTTPSFNCPPDAHLSFDTYATLGSINEDHYYVKISSDGGNNWTVLWDASDGAEGENHYAYPITVDLAAYAGTEVKLAFHAEDPPSNDGMWHEWFIDNIYIGNFINNVRFTGAELTGAKILSSNSNAGSGSTPERSARAEDLGKSSIVRSNFSSPASNANRVLIGYKVWRLSVGQENNASSWVALTDEAVTTLNYEDQGWNTLTNGNYKWAVRAIYFADVMSAPAFSNPLVKEVVSGNIVGFVRRSNGQGIASATITAEGGFSTTANNAGAYSLNLPAGIYSVTATHAAFNAFTAENIAVSPNQNTTLNFTMTPVSNEDELVPVSVTALNGNYPNPFNPETTISYDLKEAGNVRLDVYNVKGQLVRSLVNQDQTAGRYRVVFNACDEKGNPLSSGLYLYRFATGSYKSTRKMMLME